MKVPVWIFLAVLLCMPNLSQADDATAADFKSLLDVHWAFARSERIYFRSDPDAWRMEGRLSSHTQAARDRRRDFNNEILTQLADIDPGKLNDRDRVSYEVFRYEREIEKRSYEQPLHYFPFTSLFGYHTYFAEAPANMSFLRAEDYDRYLISLDDFPRYNSEIIGNLQQAAQAGFAHYCESMKDYAETISTHIVSNPVDSKLYHPFKVFPSNLSEEQRRTYSERGSALIRDKVVPGYQNLLDVFNQAYLPKCRQQAGITSVQGGDELYRYFIEYFTTTDMSPKAIHELGLAEIKRIRGEMQDIITSVKFDGGFREFLVYLREDPRFYARTVNELLGQAALISKTAEGALPRFFSVLPRGTYKIAGNPTRGTFYMPSSGDGTTSGTYFVGTEDIASQPLFTLEALTLHEGVPGHHLQTALAMEIGLPEFRRTLYHSAYGEGWGLYSEWLGKEMGFYTDPYSDFGRLTYEAWRACRLVVDTGLHAFGWTRQQAVDYMLENTALSELEVNNEIDRYITWPAQALSYKIGEIKIRELRTYAEQTLGSKFDLRKFHDAVVGNGSLPIAVLEELIKDWVASNKS